MIGGEDIVIELPDLAPSVTLPAAVRYLLDGWPTAVTQDADTGRRFDRFAEMDFGNLREVFVYRDEEAFDSWERLGAEASNANQMIHLLASAGSLTIVVDDLQDIVSASIVRGLRDRLRFGMPWFAPGREAEAA
jgi:cell fate (sporulation/competence/biofilm development) regulator YlbF (YheA/YmcA/DUF963 family)